MCNGLSTPLNPAASSQPAAQGCACGGHAKPASPFAGRHVQAGHEMEMPEVRFPSAALLAAVGVDALRRLVRRHHERLRASPIGHLFAADDAAFDLLVERIADFVVEACGGPVLYTSVHGDTCMRTRHLPFIVDERGREIWLEHLYHAMDDTGFLPEAREEYWTWLEAMSVRMINRRTMRPQPVRIPYALARVRFAGLPQA